MRKRMKKTLHPFFVGVVVTVSTPQLGALVNRVTTSDQAEPWTFGITALMQSLARRGLI